MNPKISIAQFKISNIKYENIIKAIDYIEDAGKNKCDIIVLPECFVGPYDVNKFMEISENIDEMKKCKESAVYNLIEVSKKYNMYIFASLIEKDNDNLYNTCLVLYKGEIIDKYRKMNLYKINLPDHNFCEGDILTCGKTPTIIQTKFGKIGIGICYDLRFGSLAEYYRKCGCKIIIYPGSFNRITGPKHWKLLQQARAIDNMVYIVSCSSALNKDSSYASWGKSYIINPWGDIIKETKLDEENIVYQNLYLEIIDKTRKSIPIFV